MFASADDIFEFDIYRKRQATLLYHYASMEYLRGLKDRIDALIQGVDFTLDEAQAQGRDELIANPRWGVRDTAANSELRELPANPKDTDNLPDVFHLRKS